MRALFSDHWHRTNAVAHGQEVACYFAVGASVADMIRALSPLKFKA